jgi:calretinin
MSAADLAARKRLNLEKATNFMRQFRDPETRDLKKLSANQFMDVWNNYDKDGNKKSQSFKIF